MRLLVVYNPCAGHGRARRFLPVIQEMAAQSDLDLDLRLTDARGAGTEIVRTADLSQCDGVVAAGGDGTVFEVVNGYFQNRHRGRVPMGVLPVGTGNSFARDLGLSTGQCREAVELLSRGQRRKVDVGCFRTGDQELFYLNILGLGFVSDVTATAARLKVLGSAAYTVGVVYRTAFLRTHQLTIELDDVTLERESVFVEISNSRYTADFLMAPEASIDDGLLDVTVLGRTSRRRLLRLFPKVFTGEHVDLDEVETFTASRIRVACDAPMVLAPDGELVGTTPVEVECLHQALEVFA